LLTYQQSRAKHYGVTATSNRPGPRYQALLQLLRTADTLWNASGRFFARWELSPSQFNVLNLLRDAPRGLTQIELSRQLIMHRSNVTGLVDRLEARGLLRREDDTNDRRAYRVVLSPAGQKLLREILPHYYAAAEQVWEKIPLARSNQLATDLRTLCAAAERMAPEKTE
jgi:DNA-binding MarR family transcriptional regulator